ncbi:MAG: permease-like cell division protein FtsX [Muribaculaceae bacterium]|nr:permease-like cell division protein FtsX [Muribaculaceae bacterium]
MEKQRHRKISTFGSQATSVVSVSLVLLVLGILAITGIAARSVGTTIRQSMGMVIELNEGTPDSEVNRLKQTWSRSQAVASIQYSSAEEILEQEAKAMGEDILSLMNGNNPYVDEFEIKVTSPYANADSLTALRLRLESDPAVAKVELNAEMYEQVNRNLSKVALILTIVGLALLFISIALISNTVSLSIYSRRFLIHTMRLVGAKDSFIRRPFMIAGAINGLIAAAIACGVLSLGYSYAIHADVSLTSWATWADMAIVFTAITAAGISLCCGASAIAATHYLRIGYDRMFRQ